MEQIKKQPRSADLEPKQRKEKRKSEAPAPFWPKVMVLRSSAAHRTTTNLLGYIEQ
jgi:hypothetical protein